MASSETKEKCQQNSTNLFGGERKLNLVSRGSLSKNFEKPGLN